MLEEAAHQHPLVARDDVLGTVAVVHVEVDDRHALRVIAVAGVMCGNRRLVEEAEAHGAARFRMVARRPQRAEGIVGLSPEHRIDGSGCRPHATQCRLQRSRRHHGIGIEILEAFGGRNRAQPLQVLIGMRAQDVLVTAQRRLAPFEVAEMRARQNLVHRLDAVHAFGVAVWRHMEE